MPLTVAGRLLDALASDAPKAAHRAAALVSRDMDADDDDTSESEAPAWKQMHDAPHSADTEKDQRIEGRADEEQMVAQEQQWEERAAEGGTEREQAAEEREGMETQAEREDAEEEKCPDEMHALTACLTAAECEKAHMAMADCMHNLATHASRLSRHP